MHPAEQSSFIQSLVEQPYDQRTLFAVYEAVGKDPQAYVELLVRAAENTDQHVAASHWLTEAARAKMLAIRDERGTVRLLEAALERDPLNMRAAEYLVDVYRSRHDDEELAGVLRARAAALKDRYTREPVELPKAALAFEKLSGVYEAIGDTTAAIAALRTALELERARARHTTPAPPPDVPPESSFRALAIDSGHAAAAAAPPPESPWSASPEPDPRDTLPSPLPVHRVTQPTDLVTTVRPPPAPTAPADPLLFVIEALHALRHSNDVVEASALVLRTALAAIPSMAGMVHVSDVGTRDFVVIAASGERSTDTIGLRVADGDPLFNRALHEMQALPMDATKSAWFTGARWHVLHPERTVLVAPVHYDGRHLGVIELMDPTSRILFTDSDRHAMTYVGERFGEFLSDRSMTF